MLDEAHESRRAQRPERRMLRQLAGSRAFGWLSGKVLAAPALRRVATSNFQCGRVALGQRNGKTFPVGWVTVDAQDADFSLWLTADTRLPFDDESQDVVFSAHMLEHLEDGPLQQVLHEVRRILRIGGAVRLEVPDAERLIEAYRTNDRRALDHFRRSREENLCRRLGMGEEYLADYFTVLGEVANYIEEKKDSGHIPVYASKEAFERQLAMGLETFNGWAQGLKTEEQRRSGGHSNALTFPKLEQMLGRAGFSDVRRSAFGQTAIRGLHFGSGLRRLYDGVPLAASRAFYSVFVEAFKGPSPAP